MSREDSLEKLRKMSPNEELFLDECEGGGCQVNMVEGVYILHVIPQYGGIPQYIATYKEAELEDLADFIHGVA